MKKKVYYAIYRGDEFIDLGTVNQLAKRFNVTPKTIRCMSAKSIKTRDKYYNRLLAYRIED